MHCAGSSPPGVEHICRLPPAAPAPCAHCAAGGWRGQDPEGVYSPVFRHPRLKAMGRVRHPNERPLDLADRMPRNFRDGIDFFKNGTLLLVRDLCRGTLTRREGDMSASYGRFAFLVFSSSPQRHSCCRSSICGGTERVRQPATTSSHRSVPRAATLSLRVRLLRGTSRGPRAEVGAGVCRLEVSNDSAGQRRELVYVAGNRR